MTREELTKWQEYLIGKPCPNHPNNIIMDGKYGNWCGQKINGLWCGGGWPTEEWLDNLKKGNL